MMLSDLVRYRRPKQFPGLELAEVAYRQRAFPVHIHEAYVVGIMTGGAERLKVRAAEHLAQPGDLILLEPGEPHANASVGDAGLAYRVFYVPPEMVAESFGLVRFRAAVVPGGHIGRAALQMHRLIGGLNEALEQESAWYLFLDKLFRATAIGPARPPIAAQRHVVQARAFLDEYYADAVSLGALGRVAGLSPFHLLRSFREQVGLTPGAYQIQLRVREAQRRLREGAAIAATAAELGFSDQSHLTRHFHRIVGTTPGRYAQQ